MPTLAQSPSAMTNRRLHRKGLAYNVMDEPVVASWGYWNLFEDETWEPKALDLIANLDRGSVLLDIGAWIGPMTMVAAANGINVIAVEPDPEAYRMLTGNIALNPSFGPRVHTINAAVVAEDNIKKVPLFPVQESWGSSASSLSYQHGEPVEVEAISVTELMNWCLRVDLVKMDVEGYETQLLPIIGPILRARRVPLLVATHIDRCSDAAFNSMDDEFQHWNTTRVTQDQILCTPKWATA